MNPLKVNSNLHSYLKDVNSLIRTYYLEYVGNY